MSNTHKVNGIFQFPNMRASESKKYEAQEATSDNSDILGLMPSLQMKAKCTLGENNCEIITFDILNK